MSILNCLNWISFTLVLLSGCVCVSVIVKMKIYKCLILFQLIRSPVTVVFNINQECNQWILCFCVFEVRTTFFAKQKTINLAASLISIMFSSVALLFYSCGGVSNKNKTVCYIKMRMSIAIDYRAKNDPGDWHIFNLMGYQQGGRNGRRLTSSTWYSMRCGGEILPKLVRSICLILRFVWVILVTSSFYSGFCRFQGYLILAVGRHEFTKKIFSHKKTHSSTTNQQFKYFRFSKNSIVFLFTHPLRIPRITFGVLLLIIIPGAIVKNNQFKPITF